MITQIFDQMQKKQIARQILEALPEWFEVEQSREQFIAQSAHEPFFAAIENDRPVGFLCLKQTGKDTVELAVMGVLKQYPAKAWADSCLRLQRRRQHSKAALLCRSRP